MAFKIDFVKLTQVIGVAMSIVEKVKGAKGAAKEAAVIEGVNDLVPEIEGLAGIDFVNDEKLRTLLQQYIAAKVALANAVTTAKQLKAGA